MNRTTLSGVCPFCPLPDPDGQPLSLGVSVVRRSGESN